MTVEGEHVYHVSRFGVLAHNNKCAVFSRTLTRRLSGLYSDDGATLLATALRRNGILRPAQTTPHHLIPMSMANLKGVEPLFEKAVRSGWDMNGARNGMFLDGIAHPRGNNYPNYRAFVEKQIRGYIKEHGATRNITGKKARSFLEGLGSRMKKLIEENPGRNIDHPF